MTPDNLYGKGDAAFSAFLRTEEARALRMHLHCAVHWRDKAARLRSSEARQMARRYMREAALSWRRVWAGL